MVPGVATVLGPLGGALRDAAQSEPLELLSSEAGREAGALTPDTFMSSWMEGVGSI